MAGDADPEHRATIDPGELERAVSALRRGGLVAFPTETVYGLGAAARDPAALARLYAAKGRPPTHPVIVHLGVTEASERLARWADPVPAAARVLAAAFWPGPLTLVLARAAGVPDEVCGGRPTVGLRVPAHPVALALLEAFGDGIAAPSANRFGRVSPTTARHVHDELDGVLDPDLDVVLDGGACDVGVESTIVAVEDDRVRLLRPGAIGVPDLAAVLGPGVEVEVPAAPATSGEAPGTLAAHYAPRARVVLVEAGAAGSADPVAAALRELGAAAPRVTQVGVLAPAADTAGELPGAFPGDLPAEPPGDLSADLPAEPPGDLSADLPAEPPGDLPGDVREVPRAAGALEVVHLEPVGPPEHFARVLYDRLRQADRLALDALVVVLPPPDTPLGLAVRDRLTRAAASSSHP